LSIAALLSVKMSLNFNGSYMAMGFSVTFFIQPTYADYAD